LLAGAAGLTACVAGAGAGAFLLAIFLAVAMGFLLWLSVVARSARPGRSRCLLQNAAAGRQPDGPPSRSTAGRWRLGPRIDQRTEAALQKTIRGLQQRLSEAAEPAAKNGPGPGPGPTSAPADRERDRHLRLPRLAGLQGVPTNR
jgi:hypothetical protein